jgi:hypothetical protein
MNIHDQFTTGLDPVWQITETGQGGVVRRHGSLHLSIPTAEAAAYSNAQITSYDPKSPNFQFKAPLRMSVTSFSSLHPGDLKGTAGFGFWNHPFEPGQWWRIQPQALWFFFGAPPNNMPLADGVPGHGWKAATFDAKRKRALVLLPLAPIGVFLMRFPALYRLLWPIGQAAIGVNEVLLDPQMLNSEQTYTLEWLPDTARFSVDGKLVMETKRPPRNALGFIAWMDNQYRIVTPQGSFGGGLVDVPRPQSLVLSEIKIEEI